MCLVLNKIPYIGNYEKEKKAMTTRTYNRNNYYRRNANELVMRLITGITLVLVVTSFVIVHNGNKEIRRLKAQQVVYFNLFEQEPRLSAKEELKKYVDSLPLPEDTYEEEYEVYAEYQENTAEYEEVEEKYQENYKEETQEKVDNASEEDEVMLLAKLMHAEEGVLRYKLSYDEAKLAHMLCGSVVINRRNMNYMGAKTIKDVIYTPGQYASLDSLEQDVPEETIEWARELIENGPIGPSNMIYQAQFEQGNVYEHIGNQYFCTK
jgi:hypothetical protein